MNTANLENLRIQRDTGADRGRSSFLSRSLMGIALVCLLGIASFAYARFAGLVEVETIRVPLQDGSATAGSAASAILNASGYIVAAHEIQLTATIPGKVSWIGAEKGEVVREGQELVRLQDDEYQARVMEAQGQVDSLAAHLAQLRHGSLPAEIEKAKADLDQARADLSSADITLKRTEALFEGKLIARQSLDDARGKYDGQVARVTAFESALEVVRSGARTEEIDNVSAQVRQAQGNLEYARAQLNNTVIRAPIAGTILERNVETGEFVTTGAVGDKAGKGYLLSIADLGDLDVDLDIGQTDFVKLNRSQPCVVTLEAYPDLQYRCAVSEISPEANRQKATVGVQVKIVDPDGRLKPEMNANVAFYARLPETHPVNNRKGTFTPPAAAVRGNAVFIVVEGKAVRRDSSELTGGEDLIVNPPPDVRDGSRVRIRASQ